MLGEMGALLPGDMSQAAFGNVRVRMNSNSGSHWLELPNTTWEMEGNGMEPEVR